MSHKKQSPMEKKMLEKLLGDDITLEIIREFGLEKDTPEQQAEFISQLGENVLMGITLEILQILPESEHGRFRELMSSGDLQGLQQFLSSYIPDFDRFIQAEAMKEYEATKTRMHQIQQGV